MIQNTSKHPKQESYNIFLYDPSLIIGTATSATPLLLIVPPHVHVPLIFNPVTRRASINLVVVMQNKATSRVQGDDTKMTVVCTSGDMSNHSLIREKSFWQDASHRSQSPPRD